MNFLRVLGFSREFWLLELQPSTLNPNSLLGFAVEGRGCAVCAGLEAFSRSGSMEALT